MDRTGLNFYNPVNETLFDVGNGLEQCVLEANAAYTSIGDALYAFEIGNEVDGEPYISSFPVDVTLNSLLIAHSYSGWPGTERRSANWTLDDYVLQWNHYAENITLNLTGQEAMQIVQGCAFEAPRDVFSNTSWDVANAEARGMDSNRARTVADHDVSDSKPNHCH